MTINKLRYDKSYNYNIYNQDTRILISKMSSAFNYYGSPEEVLNYLSNTVTDNRYQTMITQMSSEWRNAVVYVLGRSKSQLYLEMMFQAHEAAILSVIDPETVKGGTEHFTTVVNNFLNGAVTFRS
jgi:hypothetical protein